MLKNKKNLKLIVASVLSFCVIFLLGICVGAKFFGVQNKKIKFEAKPIRFYTIKKMLGKTMTNDEQVVVKKFQEHNNLCISGLSNDEKDKINIIKNEILSLAKNNDKIIFRLKDLQSLTKKERVLVAKKIRKCNIKSFKSLQQNERKTFRTATSKMEINDIIKLYNGIR